MYNIPKCSRRRRFTPSHARSASVLRGCRYTRSAFGNGDVQPRSWPVGRRTSNSGFMVAGFKFALPCWAERVERPRRKWGESKQRARRAKKAVGVVWESGQHQPQELPPESAPVLPDAGRKEETPASSLPKAGARRGISESLGCPGGTHR